MPIFRSKQYRNALSNSQELNFAAEELFTEAPGPETEKFAMAIKVSSQAYFYGVFKAKSMADAIRQARRLHHRRRLNSELEMETLYKCSDQFCWVCLGGLHRHSVHYSDDNGFAWMECGVSLPEFQFLEDVPFWGRMPQKC